MYNKIELMRNKNPRTNPGIKTNNHENSIKHENKTLRKYHAIMNLDSFFN